MGLKLIELFGLGSSYLFLVLLVMQAHKIRTDLAAGITVFFCAYMFLSVTWGSPVKEIARLVLPFVLFFIGRMVVKNQKDMLNIIVAVIYGFIGPILLSFTSII